MVRAAFRQTFPSGKAAAREFYDENADFFRNVRDPSDGVRDFLDGLDTAKGKRATETAAGKRVLARRSARGKIEGALAMVFASTKPKRWDAVDWAEVRRLEESLQPFYEPYSSREAQAPALYWKPLAAVEPDDVGTLSPDAANAYYAHQHRKRIKELVARVRSTFERSSKCLTPTQRKHVRARVREWQRWAKDPAKVPDYACDPDPSTGGMLCDYPSIEGELEALRAACRDKYDPHWSEAKRGEPGFPPRLSAGEREFAPIESFELEASPEPCTLKEAAGVMGRHAARKRTKKARRPRVVMGRLV